MLDCYFALYAAYRFQLITDVAAYLRVAGRIVSNQLKGMTEDDRNNVLT